MVSSSRWNDRWPARRAGRAAVVAVLLLACAAVPGGAGEITGTARPPSERYDSTVTPVDRTVCVGARFLEAGSDSVLMNGRRLEPGVDYRLDPEQGCLFLRPGAFADSSTGPRRLVIYYRRAPFRLEPVYAHRDLSGSGRGTRLDPSDSSTVMPLPPAGPVTAADTTGPSFPLRPSLGGPDESLGRPDLALSGSKTFTVDLGSSRDLSLRQTLDLKVTGTVSRDVRLNAILSDRNLPFTPEGNTAELEELDKVLIEVEAPKARVGLGDQDLTISQGDLARFSRRLQGLMIEGRGDRRRISLVGASQRGEFRSYEFLGTDGKQGPYPLIDRAGGRGVVVVAGSERVWLDGAEMVRGLDNDYTIDYSRAELTFTPRHPITAQSRVAVDYEFSAAGYRRSLYLTSGRGAGAGGALDVGFVVARESDDRDRPLGGELSPAEKSRLAAAGDSLPSGGSGIRFVGEGQGRYVDAYDVVSQRSYYRWVGRGFGRYEIAFVKVGASLGDYADSLAGADTVYVYRGPQLGEFAPAGALLPPVEQSLVQGDVRWSIGGRAELKGEAAFSSRDQNTFSPFDDGDNDGRAGRFEFRLKPVALRAGGRSLGDVDLAAGWRSLGHNFTTPGRLDGSFDYDREWNLPTRAASLAETRRSSELGWRPAEGYRLSGELAGLSGGGREADRRLARLEFQKRLALSAAWLTVDSRLDSGGASGRLERWNGDARTRLGPLTPAARWESQERRVPGPGQGERYRLGGGDLALERSGPVQLSVGYERRDTDLSPAADSTWRRDSESTTKRGRLALTGWSGLTGALLYQLRDVHRPGRDDLRTDLATLDLSRRSPDAAFAGDLHYQVGTTGVERRTRALTFVGEGKGSYDAFGNLFPGGGYELLEGPLGNEEVLTDLDVSLRLELIPYRVPESTGGIDAIRRRLAWDLTGRLQEQSRLPLGRPGRLFNPDSYQQPGETIYGRAQLRQEAEVFPESPVTLRLTQDFDDVANYQFTDFREDRTENLRGAGLRATPAGGWSLEVERRGGSRRQAVTVGVNPTSGRRAGVSEWRGRATWKPATPFKISIETTRRREEVRSDLGASAWEINPRFSWYAGSRGRLELNGRWIDATRRGGYSGVGGYSTFSLQDRLEVGLDGDYRLFQTVSLGGNVAGRRPEGSRFVVDGRMEVRAYF